MKTMFVELNISAKTAQKILSMQADMRDFLQKHFSNEDRIPFNAHRIGLYIDIENEEVAVDLGYFNYKELVALHTYVKMNYQTDYDGSTYIDHIASKGERVIPSKLSEDAYNELSMIAWLGSNVGQGFLEKFMENIKEK
jgi:hypothetical protein